VRDHADRPPAVVQHPQEQVPGPADGTPEGRFRGNAGRRLLAGQAETRSQTKMRVSPGAIAFPAPRSP
jgi:hypothetical protein